MIQDEVERLEEKVLKEMPRIRLSSETGFSLAQKKGIIGKGLLNRPPSPQNKEIFVCQDQQICVISPENLGKRKGKMRAHKHKRPGTETQVER